MMTNEHPLQKLVDDPSFAEAVQDALRLGIRFEEMITTLRAITGQSETEATRELEIAMGALISRRMRGIDDN